MIVNFSSTFYHFTKTFGPKRIILIKEIGDHKENRPPIPSGISKISSELKPC